MKTKDIVDEFKLDICDPDTDEADALFEEGSITLQEYFRLRDYLGALAGSTYSSEDWTLSELLEEPVVAIISVYNLEPYYVRIWRDKDVAQVQVEEGEPFPVGLENTIGTAIKKLTKD